MLAAGADLKNTITLTRGREAFVSQYIGDLDDRDTIRFRNETIAHLKRMLAIEPEIVACDLHPDFQSTRAAEATGLPIARVQHHLAHVAAVVAEHGLSAGVPVSYTHLDVYKRQTKRRRSNGSPPVMPRASLVL